jgi:multidrug resistance efflux pump
LILITLAVIPTILSRLSGDSELQVSGTIETRAVDIIVEAGGQISAVRFQAGERVHAGDILVQFEDQTLDAQRLLAEADLAQAVAVSELISALPMDEQRLVVIANAEQDLIQAEFALKNITNDASLARANAFQDVKDLDQALEDLLDTSWQQALARGKIAAVEKDLDTAKRQVAILIAPPSQSVIDQAYANMLLAENNLNETKDDLERAENKLHINLGPTVPKEYYIDAYKAEFRGLIQALETKLSRDQLAYQNAAQRYNNLFTPPDPVELGLAQAALAIAEAQLGQAQRDYERIQEGPSTADIAVIEAQMDTAKREYEIRKNGSDPEDLALAEAAVQAAKARLSLAKADITQEQLEVARAQVEAAQATLDIIQTQLDRLIITAPFDGVILSSSVEPGEVVKPGATVLTLGQLDQLTLTVYIPVALYNKIKLDDEVQLSVDALPEKTFTGRVIDIAEESDFVPRHVTNEGGKHDYVYMLKISVLDPSGDMKPGMLAYAIFNP